MKGAGAKGQRRDRRVLSGLESWQRLCVASSSLLSTKCYLEGSVQAGVENLKIGGRATEGSELSAGAPEACGGVAGPKTSKAPPQAMPPPTPR